MPRLNGEARHQALRSTVKTGQLLDTAQLASLAFPIVMPVHQRQDCRRQQNGYGQKTPTRVHGAYDSAIVRKYTNPAHVPEFGGRQFGGCGELTAVDSRK